MIINTRIGGNSRRYVVWIWKEHPPKAAAENHFVKTQDVYHTITAALMKTEER